jgi:hypothetical protein
MKNSPLPPSRTADQFVVRFPDGMRSRITEEAKKNNRSMNAEILARLLRSLEEDELPRVMVIEDLENILHGVLNRINDKKKE